MKALAALMVVTCLMTFFFIVPVLWWVCFIAGIAGHWWGWLVWALVPLYTAGVLMICEWAHGTPAGDPHA